MSGGCKMCGDCCKAYPCGLRPDELKPIADYLKISVKELIDAYLIQDYFIGDEGNLYYLCCKRYGDTDRVSSFGWAFSQMSCIFLTEKNMCSIHKVKPQQGKNGMPCRVRFGTGADDKKRLAELWQPFDKKLERLYEQ